MQGLFPSHCRLSLHNRFRMVPCPCALKTPANPFSRRSPTSSEQGLACAISVLSGILLRTDSCFQSDSDVKLFPWPLTLLLRAGSLPPQSLLPPARLLLFPFPKFYMVSHSVLLRPGEGSQPKRESFPWGRGGAGSWGLHFDALKLETLIPDGKPCCCAKEPPPGPHPQVGVREEEGRAEEARLCVSTSCHLVEGRDQNLAVYTYFLTF